MALESVWKGIFLEVLQAPMLDTHSMSMFCQKVFNTDLNELHKLFSYNSLGKARFCEINAKKKKDVPFQTLTLIH